MISPPRLWFLPLIFLGLPLKDLLFLGSLSG
jgi:hypothetical protein